MSCPISHSESEVKGKCVLQALVLVAVVTVPDVSVSVDISRAADSVLDDSLLVTVTVADVLHSSLPSKYIVKLQLTQQCRCS